MRCFFLEEGHLRPITKIFIVFYVCRINIVGRKIINKLINIGIVRAISIDAFHMTLPLICWGTIGL